jgi:hypothetical protein
VSNLDIQHLKTKKGAKLAEAVAAWWSEGVMTMQIQLQRRGEVGLGCRNARPAI